MLTNMDYKNITERGNLIYASCSQDQEFRRWKLNKSACYIVYYQTLELTKLDKVILLTLDFNGKKLYSNQLAKILGFNIQDDFDSVPKRYKDNGEESIFNGILKELQDYGLIQNIENQISITHLGALALRKDVKYEFYSAALPLNESFYIAQKTAREYLFFPFRDALGIISKVQGDKKLPYDKFNVSDIENKLYGAPDELVARLLLQVDADINIFNATQFNDARMGEAYVDFRLYEYNDNKYPLVFYNEEVSQVTNDLLFQQCNSDYVAHKIHIGEYLYLVRKSGKELTYSTLSPYMDIWNLNDFLDSKYLQWNDSLLFDYIAKDANGSQWSRISEICPLESLKPQLKRYETSLDWIVLSDRYDDDFIIETALLHPWDFESLSANRSLEFVKRLIVIPELHQDSIDWDWEVIMPQLDNKFVLEHIGDIPFVMFSVTDRFLSECPEIIYKFTDRKWDWKLISNQAELGYILENISALGNYIYLDDVMPRAFSDDAWQNPYCESSAFAFAVIENKDRLTSNYNANSANYRWTISLVDWHKKMGFVTWKSPVYVGGLECNKNIIWTYEFFDYFKSEEFSVKGLNHISESIVDNRSIVENNDFKWSWPILSSRDIVIQDFEFIKTHLYQLSLEILLPLVSQDIVDRLYQEKTFKEFVSAKNLWAIVTETVSENAIRRNFGNSNWDWKVLSKRFCSTMNITQLGDACWVDKLDWDYLSENLDITKIQENIDLYLDRWNWDSLTRRVDHEFLLSNLPEYYNNWNWCELLESILTDEDLAEESICIQVAIILSQLDDDITESLWAIFTTRYSTEDILSIQNNATLNAVGFKWNFKDLYNRTDFDIQPYLESYASSGIDVDWDVLSSSKALDRILRWDKKIAKDFKNWEDLVLSILENEEFEWNFAYLSTLTSINWCDNILKVRSDEWDWDYLSEHSSCFSYNPKKPKELIKHIEKFSDFLNFKILSGRKDAKLDIEAISSHINYDWDWMAISANKSIELSTDLVQSHMSFPWDWQALSARCDCAFTLDFIKENKNLNWDWSTLSKRKDINFNSEFLITLSDKDWNWSELLHRKDIEFSAELLRLIVGKDLKWFSFSQRNDFYPSMEILGILKDKDLDWKGISRREELAYNVILVYKDKLDWKILSHNSHIDVSSSKVLDTFKDYLDWNFVSNNPSFSLKKESLCKFKDYVNWTVICRRQDFKLDEDILEEFESYIDWSIISRSGVIAFTQEIVDKYKDRWDWVALSENPSFRALGIESSFKKELNLMEFYNELNSCRRCPYIYHFTHFFNAIEIIKTRKILSRNKAIELGLLKYDAAGSVVNRSAKAHPFARFYYRTGTQTQFYNECLGKDRTMKYYNRAINNGLPMCPMPVFFKFDLQEVLAKKSSSCYYSTGNMQTGWARVYQVIDDPSNIDAQNLYSSGNSKTVQEKKQQEFLVKNEFDFTDLSKYQIICYDREQADMFMTLFKGNPICEHIYAVYDADEDVFDGKNPPLRFEKNSNSLSITTRYNGEYIFQIESNNVTKVNVLNFKDIKAGKKNIIQLYSSVSVELGDTPFDIFYVNMSPVARSPRWLIYQHTPEKREVRYTKTDDIEKFLGISFDDEEFSPEELITSIEIAMPKLEKLYNKRVRHYVVKQHTLLVCEQFEKYAFDFNQKVMNLDLMRLILAMHDVGKAIDRATQHEHTLSLVREFWLESPFTEYELQMTEILLKNDNLGNYFQRKFDLLTLKDEILADADMLQIDASSLLQLKMILYQCDIASYTKDAGGLKYLELMFVYVNGEKSFNEEEGLLNMSSNYWNLYLQLKAAIYE